MMDWDLFYLKRPLIVTTMLPKNGDRVAQSYPGSNIVRQSQCKASPVEVLVPNKANQATEEGHNGFFQGPHATCEVKFGRGLQPQHRHKGTNATGVMRKDRAAKYGTHHSYVLVVHTLRVAENEIF
jgi:hypothetical protein